MTKGNIVSYCFLSNADTVLSSNIKTTKQTKMHSLKNECQENCLHLQYVDGMNSPLFGLEGKCPYLSYDMSSNSHAVKDLLSSVNTGVGEKKKKKKKKHDDA